MAHITSAEVKAARMALKKAFPKFKFSVQGGGTLAINISIMTSPLDMTKDLNGSSYASVNTYYLHQYEHGEVYKEIMKVAMDAIAEAGNPYFDHSDLQTDYFHCAYYKHLNIGKWDQHYKQIV